MSKIKLILPNLTEISGKPHPLRLEEQLLRL